jgi:prolyl-tRNA synthetase
VIKWSEYLLPTLKEAPSDAESVSHKLMLRAGLIQKLSSGVYSYLPCGLRVLQKIKDIIRQEMNSIGAQEILMPAIHPLELWLESKRWEHFSSAMYCLSDVEGKTPFVLGATHEAVITDIARTFIHSYKDLPKILYQLQTKFRNEPRPRFGLVRCREFIMMDAYSFHSSNEDLDQTYNTVYDAHRKIFQRCGLDVIIVEADSGPFGGGVSNEFMVLSDCGEDRIIVCTNCSYAANMEKLSDVKQEECPKCGRSVSKQLAIEIDHIFKLGTTYSIPLRAVFLDENGSSKPFIMGCYGIGVSRLLSAILEKNNDEDGICWPSSVAPFDVVITQIDMNDQRTKSITVGLCDSLVSRRLSVIVDDRDKRPGVKFKDADLVGFPIRIVVGQKGLKENKVEVYCRKTKQVRMLEINEVVGKIVDDRR